jgi:hypothetical protein
MTMREQSALSRRTRGRNRAPKWPIVVAIVILGIVLLAGYIWYEAAQRVNQKPIILYVNQGNGVVNGTKFGALLTFASSHEFNTIFFQVYREGRLLFSPVTLGSFVNQTHEAGLKIFFALYITSASQSLPSSVFQLHEDGISLDMPVVSVDTATQESFLSELKSGYIGTVAITTSDMNSPLRPDLLVLETYTRDTQQFIRNGIVGSVGVFATSSKEDYQSQFNYALSNSDGVMVFDYYGLAKAGY